MLPPLVRVDGVCPNVNPVPTCMKCTRVYKNEGATL
jgi:hypothetical protein